MFSFFDCVYACYGYDTAEAEYAEGSAVVLAEYVQVFGVDYTVLINVAARAIGYL